jgi:CheY-like chemotaxis protein
LKSTSDIRSEIGDPTRHGGRSPTLLAPVDILKEVEVLIAEDNVINQKVLCGMLQRSGMERIDVVQNGQGTVERCASKQYDVIFMDMQMPIMCGDEACRIILESYKGRPRRPKIAFVSAHVSTTIEAQAFDACRRLPLQAVQRQDVRGVHPLLGSLPFGGSVRHATFNVEVERVQLCI